MEKITKDEFYILSRANGNVPNEIMDKIRELKIDEALKIDKSEYKNKSSFNVQVKCCLRRLKNKTGFDVLIRQTRDKSSYLVLRRS